MDTSDFEKMEREKLTNPYAERWDGAMADAPEYGGDNNLDGAVSMETPAETLNTESAPAETLEANSGIQSPETTQPIENSEVAAENGEQIQRANKLAGYGLDVASREYGVEAVVQAIKNIDLTDRDADQPIGAIYLQLAPERETRQDLFQKISADEDYMREARTTTRTLEEQRHAVAAAQGLFDALGQHDRFAPMRAEAERQGQDIITFLAHMGGRAKPTLSDLLGKIGENFNVDATAAELERELRPEDYEEQIENAKNAIAAAEKVEINSEGEVIADGVALELPSEEIRQAATQAAEARLREEERAERERITAEQSAEWRQLIDAYFAEVEDPVGEA